MEMDDTAMSKIVTVRKRKIVEPLIVALFIACGPFLRGYMFETEFMGAAVAVFLGFMIVMLRGSLPRDKTFYLLLALTAIYAASIGYGTDHREAAAASLRMALLIPLYVCAQSVPRRGMDRIWSVWVWMTGLSVPLAVATGSYVDGRLVGFIDYANGYAIMLLVGLLTAVSLAVKASSRARLWQIPILLCAGGIYLTESRTVLLLLAVAAVSLFARGMGIDRKVSFRSTMSIVMGIAAAAAYEWSPLLVIPVLLAFGLAFRVSDPILSRRSVKTLLMGIGLLLAAASLFLGSGMADRWSTAVSRTGEGFTRLVYYGDAWSMIMDSPVWGFGAGAWTYLQYRYQSADYFTAYVHSEPLQLMLEVGIVGFLIFGAACATLLVRGFSALKRVEKPEAAFRRIQLGACCLLIVHGLVDFSMSFPYLLGLFFIMGASAGSSDADGTASAGSPVAARTAAIALSAGILVIAAMLAASDRFEQSAEKAIAQGRKADAVRLLDRSAKTAMFPDRIHDSKARMYLAEFEKRNDCRYLDVALNENDKSLDIHPEQTWYRKLNSDLLWLQGERQASLTILRELVSENRFRGSWREELYRREKQ